MRVGALVWVGLAVAVAAPPALAQEARREARQEAWQEAQVVRVAGGDDGSSPAARRGGQSYEGYWAGTAAACRDEDNDDRMSIQGTSFQWYETRCTASDIRPAGQAAWTMRMSCEGEGQRFSVRPRVSLPSPDRLVMENGPVGRDPKRQSYLRCIAR